jgi:HD-GYP domain-containing protein (c-di-GMP phosphodiesterase class II)
MARKPAPKSKKGANPLLVGLKLRIFFYAAGILQLVGAQGTKVLPVALGLGLALIILATVGAHTGRAEDGEQQATIFAGVEAILVSFVVHFAGPGSAIILLPVVLCALLAAERGANTAFIFALMNSAGWLAPTLMDKNLGNMNVLGVIFRLCVLCATPFVVTAIPRVSDDGHEAIAAREQSKALERAQQTARAETEARKAREQDLYAERRKLEALMQIAHRMAVMRRPDELLATIVTCAREQLQVDVAAVLLRRGQQLVVEWKEGLTETTAARLNCPLGHGLLGRLVLSGESFMYTLADGVEPFRPFWPLHGMEQIIPTLRAPTQGFQPHSEDLRNFLVVPLKTPLDQAPFGLLLVGNRLVGERFDMGDQGYLHILGTDAAISIRNLFFVAELERSHREMIQALAQAIEAKDPYTSGHVARVRSYSLQLARAMGMSHTFLQDLDNAATLHDVGKISTPDNILMKQGPLSDEEFAVMKQHVVHSVRIIRDIRSVSPEIQKMVLYHHERWDGKGYPEGIAGDQIPLGAQIIAVADAYDAMTSDRPYRKGFDPEEAMRRMEGGSGSQFNSQVLSYFMAMFGYEPKENALLGQLVQQAKQRVGANLLRTSAPGTPSGASHAPNEPVPVVQEAAVASSGPARRGPERLELDQ